ncbi:ROK family transcriptional regulator [Wenjunlia tyrosinilytica]|uniref:Transcriptional regulator n=1 Tax=Wenjunlia tyrosinilytica TaxID=1544741 RepID=A0A917ZFU7_9ACTN|nr:ROK family transcriptional regulator [Wenjunlia tyrosinilytica]GGO82210.1 transcriptional regulator [Wenjunlia tyrosinilytica]
MTTARTASPRTARAINDRLALELLVERGPLTANQLKQATGLSRPTVADLVERLRDGGLIRVVGEAGEQRRGPNARLYGLAADRAHIAAADVRTRSVSLAVADLAGGVLAETVLPVDPSRPAARIVEDAVSALGRTLRESGADATLHTIVVGAPGLVDPATGELSATGALPAWHAEFVAALRTGLDAPVLLDNEVNLAGIAEAQVGAAADRETFVLMWLGHGVGAAVILEGRLRRGASGGTGEIGFLPVPGTSGLPSATVCDGGFHSLAGSAAVCALARRHGIAAASEDDPPAAEAALGEALGTGNGAFLDELAGRIAIGAAALTAVLDPGCVVLGGEVGRAGGAELTRRVQTRLEELSPLHTQVRAGTVEGSPVLRGAMVIALDAARRDLFATV